MVPLPYESMSDEALMATYYGCDNKAFDALQTRQYAYIHALHQRWGVKQQADADDLTSVTFIKAARTKFSGSGRFDPNREQFNVQAWLTGIARHTHVAYWRSMGRQIPTFPSLEGPAGPVDRGDGPVVDVEREEERQAVRECLETLPERERIALQLRYEAGLTYQAITYILHCSINTVRRLEAIGLRLMGECLKKKGIG
jgi:RNA polymerase sigma-70 factor (ECF subfamily)